MLESRKYVLMITCQNNAVRFMKLVFVFSKKKTQVIYLASPNRINLSTYFFMGWQCYVQITDSCLW